MNKTKSILQWVDVKDKLFLRLENYEKNTAEMGRRIYVPFLDLAIFIYCDWKEEHCNGVYVNRDHLILWNQSVKNVFQTALNNTFHKDNVLVTPIETLLPPITTNGIHAGDGLEKGMIVLTNRESIYGAAMMLNIAELKKLAEQLNSDLYLLPSSIHEILVIRPDRNVDVSALMDMVQDVNRSVVDPEDYLSDHVYYFDRKKCRIEIAAPKLASVV